MFAACKEVDDTVVLSIAKNCPNLKRLSLRGCKVTDPSVCEVAIHCHKLLLLALAGLHKLTDKCVIALAGNCPYLEELYISGCGMITPAATRYLQVIDLQVIVHVLLNTLTLLVCDLILSIQIIAWFTTINEHVRICILESQHLLQKISSNFMGR